MIVRATFDNDGLPTGFYPEDIWPEGSPSDAMEISEEDYREFMNFAGQRRWDGSRVVQYTPAEPEPQEPSVPHSVTIRQAKLQMSRAGILSAVDAAIAGMEGQAGEEARIEWQYATELRREHPLVEALGPTLGLSDEAIDALFVEAAKIA